MVFEEKFVLDQHEDGYFLARWHKDTYPIGRDKVKAEQVLKKLNKSHRPNLEISENTLYICWNLHEKGDKCEYEVLVENAA